MEKDNKENETIRKNNTYEQKTTRKVERGS